MIILILYQQKIISITQARLILLKKSQITRTTRSYLKVKLLNKSKKQRKQSKLLKSRQRYVLYIEKDLKLSDIQIIEIYESSFQYVQSKIRQIIYPVKFQKSDFQLYMMKRRFNNNQNTCGITMNIGNQKYDDRMLLDVNLAQIFDFQCHRFSLKSLIMKTSQILKNFKFHQVLYQNNNQIDVLLHEIVKNYNLVPYHNFTHAFSVFSMFYYFSKSKTLVHVFDEFQLYFSLIACLSHDLRHNGFNSIFEMKTKSELAMTFGNSSILQKMHKNVTLQILENLGQNSPFSTLSEQQKRKAKRIVTNLILATDMARHYEYVLNLKQKKLNLLNPEERLYLMQGLIHACDIGNSLLYYENYITWANLVCVQFHQQTIQQQVCRVQPTAHMKFESLNYFYKNQATFLSNHLDTIVLPMWQVLDEQLNQEKIREKIAIVKDNSKKISEQLRRNSQRLPQNNIAKYLESLLKDLKL